MKIENKYVVLDVETNGLSSLKDDLLSISIYKPDDKKTYNRFLPLELSQNINTTHINGITKKDLKNTIPLNQKEVDELIQIFELDKRVILTYGSLDEKFIKNYFKRKNIYGFEIMTFYNYKKDIISSRFSEGNITKDNLCTLFKIKNVQKTHTGVNDCVLEWELFKKINEKKLFITNNKVFEMSDDYIIPVSYLNTHPSLSNYIGNLPNIIYNQKIIKEFKITSKKIKKFPTNFNGVIIEQLINTMLNVEEIDSKSFLYENKSKLNYIGTLPSTCDIIPISFHSDGTIKTIRNQDKQLEKEINVSLNVIKKEIKPLIQFISKEIFHGQKIFSQELVVHPENKILAICDLSTPDIVMEIKTNDNTNDINNIKNQLFYESNGRACYLLQTDWSQMPNNLCFIISKITFEIGEPKKKSWQQFQDKIKNKNIIVTKYVNKNTKVKLQCKLCNYEWESSCTSIIKLPVCPSCNSIVQKCH